jgi:hypothetical protein
MRILRKLLVMAVAAVMATGCGIGHVIGHLGGPQVVGSGMVTTATRTVGSFKAVQLDGSFDADITIGKQSQLKISGEDNIVPLVKTEVKGDTLRIYLEGSFTTHEPLKVTFSVPELRNASLNGSGDVAIHSYRGKELTLDIKGSGDVAADGTADKLVSSIKGSGNLDLFGLTAKDVRVSISGSGDAEVHATQSLDAVIAGSGDIRYKGSPGHVKRSISGSGEIPAAS